MIANANPKTKMLIGNWLHFQAWTQICVKHPTFNYQVSIQTTPSRKPAQKSETQTILHEVKKTKKAANLEQEKTERKRQRQWKYPSCKKHTTKTNKKQQKKRRDKKKTTIGERKSCRKTRFFTMVIHSRTNTLATLQNDYFTDDFLSPYTFLFSLLIFYRFSSAMLLLFWFLI